MYLSIMEKLQVGNILSSALFHFDKDCEHRAVGRLTSRHVHFGNLDELSVKRAAQVPSHSVAAALCYLSFFYMVPRTANYTADFFSLANGMFDSMNSRELRHKTNPLVCSYTRILSLKNMEKICRIYEDSSNWHWK